MGEYNMKSVYNSKVDDMTKEKEIVPLWNKYSLTLEEAADYFNIGVNKLRDLTNDNDCQFVLFNGTKRLIKRELFEEYLNNQISI